jgi:hypothetical protein
VLDGERARIRSCSSIGAQWVDLRCRGGNGSALGPGSLRRWTRDTASSIAPSRTQPRAPSRPGKLPGVFSVVLSHSGQHQRIETESLAPRTTLEYGHARQFHIDPPRVLHARDKGASKAPPAPAMTASPGGLMNSLRCACRLGVMSEAPLRQVCDNHSPRPVLQHGH